MRTQTLKYTTLNSHLVHKTTNSVKQVNIKVVCMYRYGIKLFALVIRGPFFKVYARTIIKRQEIAYYINVGYL